MKNKILILVSAISVACFSISTYAEINSSDQSTTVTEHNKKRTSENAGIPNLKWSGTLASHAQSWANTLKGKGCKLEHSTGSGFGENIFWAGPIMWSDGKTEAQAIKPSQVVDAWYGEKSDYNISSNSCAGGKTCGHYTQVVWKETTEVGCGSAVCDDKSQVWVCNYAPPGNMSGEKPF